MNAHFLEGIEVNRFCLTLVGEARLWYESSQPINVDWQDLQNLFRQQYSKIGNTREQLFYAWRSFHFDKYRDNRCICNMNKTSSYTFRLWETTNSRNIQKHTPHKIILGIIPHRGHKTSGRDSTKY